MPQAPGSSALIFQPGQVGLEAAMLMLPWDAGAVSLPFWYHPISSCNPTWPYTAPPNLLLSLHKHQIHSRTSHPLCANHSNSQSLHFLPPPHRTQCLVLRLHFHPKYSSKLIRHEVLYAKTGTFPMGKQQSQSSQAWQETPYFQEPRVMWDKLNDATQQVSQRNTARAMTRPTRLKISQCLPSLYILLHLMCHNYSSLCTRSCV